MIQKGLVYNLLLCTVISGTSACAIPMGGHYYYPSSSYGKVIRAYCKGGTGPENSIEMKLGDSEVVVSATNNDKSLTHINLIVYKKENSIIELDPSKIRVYEDTGDKALDVQDIKTIYLSKNSNVTGVRREPPNARRTQGVIT